MTKFFDFVPKLCGEKFHENKMVLEKNPWIGKNFWYRIFKLVIMGIKFGQNLPNSDSNCIEIDAVSFQHYISTKFFDFVPKLFGKNSMKTNLNSYYGHQNWTRSFDFVFKFNWKLLVVWILVCIFDVLFDVRFLRFFCKF